MDISIRDKVLDNLQVELGHRKNILRNKFVNIDELSKENTFLSGVKDDYKKHYGYLTGLSKTTPNLIRAIKSVVHGVFTFNFEKVLIHYVEIEGLLCSYLNIKSFYRIKNKKLL